MRRLYGREEIRFWCHRKGPDGVECGRSQMVEVPTASNTYDPARGQVLRCRCGTLGHVYRDQRGELNVHGYLYATEPEVKA